jgi:hypothetical protein
VKIWTVAVAIFGSNYGTAKKKNGVHIYSLGKA